MQGNGCFYKTEIRSQMTAMYAYPLNDGLAHFFRQLFPVLGGILFYILWAVDFFQIHS